MILVGIETLAWTLVPISMVRFLQQFDTGKGDYTKERKQWLDEIIINEVLKGIEEERERK